MTEESLQNEQETPEEDMDALDVYLQLPVEHAHLPEKPRITRDPVLPSPTVPNKSSCQLDRL